MITAEQLGLAGLEQKYGLPSGLLSAVMQRESSGNPNAVSKAGAQGLFQFMPATAQAYGIDPLDPIQAADGAARMYSDLNKQYKGDLPSMLAAYNWGSGNLAKHGIANAPQETKDYIANITGDLSGGAGQDTMAGGNAGDVIAPPEGFDFTEPPQSAPPPPEGFDLAEPPKEKRFIERVTEDIQKRGEQGRSALAEYRKGNQTGAEAALQVFGKAGAGTVNDVLGQGVSSLYGYAKRNVPGVEEAEKEIKSAGSSAGDTQLGRGAADILGNAVESYGKFAESNPRAARNIESIANIAAAVPAVGELGVAANATRKATGGALESVGTAVQKSGIRSAEKVRSDFVDDLILPKQTASVREDQVGRTKEVGLNRRKVVELTPQEKEVAATVSNIKDVKKGNSLQGNANAIQRANREEADALIARIQKNDVKIADNTVNASLDAVQQSLAKNPYIVGDGAKSAQNIIDNARSIIANNNRTASGMLQARKQFDAWVKSQKNVFDANLENPITTAVREVRQSMNKMVADAVPSADVQASLAKQSNLYRAHEAVATKAKDEASSRLGRVAQKVGRAATVKNGVVTAGALAGLSATGAAVPIAGGALAAYGAGKAIASPSLRKGIGSTVKTAGKVLGGKKAKEEVVEAVVAPQQAPLLALPAPRKTTTYGTHPADIPKGETVIYAKGPETKMLPAPESAYVSNSKGAARKQTSSERDAGITARQRGQETGLTLDVRKAQQMLESDRRWTSLEKSQKDKIAREVAESYRQNQRPITEIIEESLAKADRTYDPADTTMMEALRSLKSERTKKRK